MIVRPRGPLAGIVVLAVSALIVGLAPTVSASTQLRQKMLAATNDSRSLHNRAALTINMRLSKLGLRHTRAMADRDELFHVVNPTAYYLRGVSWHVWGENVGYTSGTVHSLEKAFMHSPDHRANILNGAFTHVAVGVIRSGGLVWVTVFFYG